MTNTDCFHLVTIEDGQNDSNAIIRMYHDIHADVIPCDVKLLDY